MPTTTSTSPVASRVGATRPSDGAAAQARSGAHRSKETAILATAVFLTGSSACRPGMHYALAIRGDSLLVLGPLEVDPDVIAVERPLGSIAVTAYEDQLLVNDRRVGDPDLVAGLPAPLRPVRRDGRTGAPARRQRPGLDGDMNRGAGQVRSDGPAPEVIGVMFAAIIYAVVGVGIIVASTMAPEVPTPTPTRDRGRRDATPGRDDGRQLPDPHPERARRDPARSARSSRRSSRTIRS